MKITLGELRSYISEATKFSFNFEVGDAILFGKWKNKRGKIVDMYLDDKGNPTIDIEPTPKGRKKNVTMGLYRVRKDKREDEEEK